ncbi:hypothetical protein KJN74_00105 [Candidatus Bathyarchaeota archaeon]|nr:hypothetical protein [Candidatus Bathyarchaeota archaeon]
MKKVKIDQIINFNIINNLTEKRQIQRKKPELTTQTKVYIVIVALVLSAIKTIIPFPYVSKPCMLGYKAGCSFTPISTIILVVATIIVYVGAKRRNIL